MNSPRLAGLEIAIPEKTNCIYSQLSSSLETEDRIYSQLSSSLETEDRIYRPDSNF